MALSMSQRGLRASALLMVATTLTTRSSEAPPVITVDLDSPPQDRWAGAVAAVLAVHPWEYSFGPTFAGTNATLFDKVLNTTHWQTMGAAVEQASVAPCGLLSLFWVKYIAPRPPYASASSMIWIRVHVDELLELR